MSSGVKESASCFTPHPAYIFFSSASSWLELGWHIALVNAEDREDGKRGLALQLKEGSCLLCPSAHVPLILGPLAL